MSKTHSQDTADTPPERSRIALEAFFDEVGARALEGVITGRITHSKATSYLLMLRKLMTSNPPRKQVENWFREHRLHRNTDFSYLPEERGSDPDRGVRRLSSQPY